MKSLQWAWCVWLPLLVACGAAGTAGTSNVPSPASVPTTAALASAPTAGGPAATQPSAPPVTAPTVAPVPTAVPVPTAAPVPTAGPLAPELVGGQSWVNSAPLTLAGLRGKVVLIDFWTQTCYNCRNTLPAVRGWWDKYKDQGLVIIGVHTPEFQSEHDLAGVQQAVKQQQIGWPVVQDNDYKIWSAYNNRYWPRFYLVDAQGHIIYDHIGEGAYDETEQRIVSALAAAKQ